MNTRFVFVFLTLSVLVPAWAKAQGVRFKGVITDEDGNSVVGALVRVEAVALDTSISGSGKSKKGGRYGLFVMQPARQYRITVTKDGYKEFAELFDAGSAWTKEHLRIDRDFTLEKGTGGGQVRIPEDVRAIYNKGIEAYNKRDWANARTKFERVLKIRPRLAAVHFALAQTCVFQGDNDMALASAERAVELDAENREAIELLIKIHRGLGNDTRADEVEKLLETVSGEAGSQGVRERRGGGIDEVDVYLSFNSSMPPAFEPAKDSQLWTELRRSVQNTPPSSRRRQVTP